MAEEKTTTFEKDWESESDKVWNKMAEKKISRNVSIEGNAAIMINTLWLSLMILIWSIIIKIWF